MTAVTGRAALSVHLVPAQPSARTLAALAALPERFRRLAPVPAGEGGPQADVWVVSGSTGWPQRVADAIDARPRAVVLEGPDPVAPPQVEALAARAAERGVVVAVDTDYAANPLWRSVQPLLLADLAGSALLDAVATVADAAAVDRALLALLAAVRPLLSGAGLTAVPRRSAACRVAVGAGALAVTVAAVAASGLPALELDLVGAQRRWTVCLPVDGTARPAEAALHDLDGDRAFRPVFESATRATWRDLAAELNGGRGSFHRLADLVADLQLYATLQP